MVFVAGARVVLAGVAPGACCSSARSVAAKGSAVADKIGNVTERRYDTLVGQASDAIRSMTKNQFTIGDMALEIQPMRPTRGGRDEGIYASLRAFADDIGELFETVRMWRWVANAWPKKERRAEASFTVHRLLASHPDRFTMIRKPPLDRRGRRHWTTDAAAEAVGHHRDVSHETRVRKIRELASDDAVASTVASEFLDRPHVASKVLANPITRRRVYQAQREHDEQVQEAARERTPAIKHVEHSLHYLDLLGVGHGFVTGIKRLMPLIQDNPLTRQERDAVHHMLDQVQAATDFCRSVLNTGDLSIDEQLAKLLDDEEEP